jgi:glycine N-methyltransferase
MVSSFQVRDDKVSYSGNDQTVLSFSQFRLSYYPHRLAVFREMLLEAFGTKCKRTIYGDFKLLQEVDNPDFYIHVMEKL